MTNIEKIIKIISTFATPIRRALDPYIFGTISTSKKKQRVARECVSPPQPTPLRSCYKTQTEPVTQAWVSYGFDYTNKKDDTDYHNASFFFAVTLCLVGGSFLWAYAPDVHMRDWAQREAFLELRRRERENKPAVSPHFIDPNNIKLPNESELCDVEVLI
ncbi:hypothetical protein O0L34_g5366 [Tuta absoluta]|nr:hypothetical protein O0L34_g5366 [Tuta absoluta]